jgi:2-haloacid dehalogenase
MRLNGVRALLFKVFGTVVDWRTGVAHQAAPFLRRHGAESVDPWAFADAWRPATSRPFVFLRRK